MAGVVSPAVPHWHWVLPRRHWVLPRWHWVLPSPRCRQLNLRSVKQSLIHPG